MLLVAAQMRNPGNGQDQEVLQVQKPHKSLRRPRPGRWGPPGSVGGPGPGEQTWAGCVAAELPVLPLSQVSPELETPEQGSI